MKRYFFHRGIIGRISILSLVLIFGGFFVVHPVHAVTVFSEEALVDLVKPSVVRITEHVTGTAKIPTVKVDIKKRLVAVVPDRFTEVPIDEYLSGTGFIVHPDGYIATNAHVVSLETIKTTLASESALSAVFENALLLSEKEMDDFLSEEGNGQEFSRDIIRYIIEQSTFDLKHEIAVLRPGVSGAAIGELLAGGFPAELVAVNERFLDDERDVALIKIQEEQLPSLSLGNADDLGVGKKVFILGFPSTAEINENSPSEATFTQGVVSAIKQTEDGQLRIFQTDAKVSQGSSGGPLFNDRGEVLGMVTFQTDELSRAAGDNFAFALPVDVVKKQALEARILPEEGIYGQAFRAGFAAYSERHCDTALSWFVDTKKTNIVFLTDRIVQPYIETCRAWQDNGQARDTYWDEFRDGVGTLSDPFLYVIGGSIFSFGVLGAMIFWLFRQLRREGREIVFLQHRLQRDEAELKRHELAVGDPIQKSRPLHKKV